MHCSNAGLRGQQRHGGAAGCPGPSAVLSVELGSTVVLKKHSGVCRRSFVLHDLLKFLAFRALERSGPRALERESSQQQGEQGDPEQAEHVGVGAGGGQKVRRWVPEVCRWFDRPLAQAGA